MSRQDELKMMMIEIQKSLVEIQDRADRTKREIDQSTDRLVKDLEDRIDTIRQLLAENPPEGGPLD